MAKDNDELVALMRQLVASQSESSKMLTSLDKKVDLHIQKTEYELRRINELDEVQNDLLDKHIAGVETLRKIHDKYAEITDARLIDLETPRRWLSTSMKVFLTIGGICSAIAGILKLFHVI